MHAFTRTRTGAAGTIAVACLAVLLGGCGSSSEEPEPLGPAVPYTLYTHCGIRGAHYEGRYYEVVPPLDDHVGPPAGWGQTVQQGTLTPVSETEVVFTDDAGHRVTFTLRPGATGPKLICA
ncbi:MULTISPECIES: hypothetical protein [Pseudofrankia]|uniref:hypothetical protein n=1 Tax=Pseudofrankia TaxID=2994363 RepID=UPI000301ED66|nr:MULTISPECIES: hypothetical protein [Pseudofrankia]OHV32076.1 hypothetical protein BCD49_30900 [Pseudofrankia sp. EUN1h]